MADKEVAKSTNKKPFYKQVWFWVVAIIVIIIVGAVVGSSGKDPKKVGEGDNSSSESSDNKSDDNKNFKVGDVIAIDDQEVTITSVERNYEPANEYVAVKDGKEFVKLNLQIKNTSSDKKDYNALYWTVEDSNGDIINYSSAMFAQADDELSSGQLAAGGTKKASLVFEVPKDDKLKVHFKPNLILDREAIIEL